MSLDEYNRHSTLGPMAGPATSPAASAGQAAWQRANEPPRPAQAGPATAPATVAASLGLLGALAAIFAVSLVCAFLLPGTLGSAAILAAVASGPVFVILGIPVGIEASKSGLAWLLEGLREHGPFWSIGAALAAYGFASVYWYVFRPVPAWLVALLAACLALAARATPGLRPFAAGMAAAVVTYVLVASAVTGRHGLEALGIALAASAVTAGVWQAGRLLRATNRSGGQSG